MEFSAGFSLSTMATHQVLPKTRHHQKLATELTHQPGNVRLSILFSCHFSSVAAAGNIRRPCKFRAQYRRDVSTIGLKSRRKRAVKLPGDSQISDYRTPNKHIENDDRISLATYCHAKPIHCPHPFLAPEFADFGEAPSLLCALLMRSAFATSTSCKVVK